MDSHLSPDLTELQDQFEAAARDAVKLVAGLSEERGTARFEPSSWSVAECLDHLATGNRVYLKSMHEPASLARSRGKYRRGPAKPGPLGGWFARSLEPPVKRWSKLPAPRIIRPASVPLDKAFAGFNASQGDVLEFLRANADLDLAGIRFPNPFVRGLRLSLASGLHVIAAHERRHLWQAWGVRRALEQRSPT